MMVLVLPEWVAPNLSTKLALKSEFDWVVVLVLPKWVAPKTDDRTGTEAQV
jgi:hypothetical protein